MSLVCVSEVKEGSESFRARQKRESERERKAEREREVEIRYIKMKIRPFFSLVHPYCYRHLVSTFRF